MTTTMIEEHAKRIAEDEIARLKGEGLERSAAIAKLLGECPPWDPFSDLFGKIGDAATEIERSASYESEPTPEQREAERARLTREIAGTRDRTVPGAYQQYLWRARLPGADGGPLLTKDPTPRG